MADRRSWSYYFPKIPNFFIWHLAPYDRSVNVIPHIWALSRTRTLHGSIEYFWDECCAEQSTYTTYKSSIFYAMQDYAIFDCHAHLHEGNFPPEAENSLDVILDNARKANVQTIVSVSEGLIDAPKVLKLAAESNGLILAGVGLHPVQTSKENGEQIERSATLEDFEEFLPYISQCIDDKRISCVGEG